MANGKHSAVAQTAANLFGEAVHALEMSAEQRALVDKIRELQESSANTQRLSGEVIELASRVILSTTVTTPAEKKPHEVKQALTVFDNEHQRVTGERAKIEGGRDATIMKRLIERYTLARVETLIREFFKIDDEFVTRRTGYTVVAFNMKVPALISSASAPSRVGGATERTRENERYATQGADLIRRQFGSGVQAR